MQDRSQHERHGPGKVKDPLQLGIADDLTGLTQVGVDVGGGPLRGAGKQGTRVREHDRVVVNVDDPRRRGDPLGDLVHVRAGGDAGADVQELPDPFVPGQEGGRAPDKPPVLDHSGTHGRERGRDGVSRFPVSGEIVLAAEPVVIAPGGMRHRRVDRRRRLPGIVRLRSPRQDTHPRLPALAAHRRPPTGPFAISGTGQNHARPGGSSIQPSAVTARPRALRGPAPRSLSPDGPERSPRTGP